MIRSAIIGLSIVALASVPTMSAKAESLNSDRVREFQLSQVTVAQIASGSFTTVEQDHPTNGTAQIVEEGGQRYLEFSGDFTTAQGPNVEVILYQGGSVPVNLEEGTYVTIAPLQSFDGAQRYSIPSDIDLSGFGAVGIWCRQFNVTFGYAPI
ncbi:MAG TPA: DM13 domain-containing protein [Elainellaceae cyanobacterium]